MRLILFVLCALCITLTFQNMHVRQDQTHAMENHDWSFGGWLQSVKDTVSSAASSVSDTVSSAVAEGDRIGCKDNKCWADCGRLKAWCWTSGAANGKEATTCSGDNASNCPKLLRDNEKNNLNCVGRCAPV